LPIGDNDERRLNLHGRLAQGVNHCEHEPRDSQLPGVLAFEHVGGVPKRRGEAVQRELRILRENLFLRCPARGEFEQELDAEARASNGLPPRICGSEMISFSAIARGSRMPVVHFR